MPSRLARPISSWSSPTVLLALWISAFVLPAAADTFFDGVPFSSIPEAFALALLVPLLVSPTYRRTLARWLSGCPVSARIALFGAALLALALKVVLVPAPPSGFPACYESTLTPPPAGACERSFENPFFRFGATRVDSTIDFGPEDWNLSFFNSLRFNFYVTQAGNPRRDRLPFTVAWRGAIDAHADRAMVTYVGQGIVAIDGSTLSLPAAYDAERTLPIHLPPGRHILRVRYTFDDGSRVGEDRPLGPYATFRIRTAAPGGTTTPVHAAPSRIVLRTAALALDVLGTGLTVALLFWYGWLLRCERRSVLIVVIAFAAAFLATRGTGLAVAAGATLVTCCLLALILARNRSSRLLLAYLAVLFVSVWLAIGAYSGVRSVAYRSAGNDWLTYEALARTVLETGSLEGGEPVFYIQPLFRYVRFLEHFLLGDGDPLIDIFACTLLSWGILWAASALIGVRALTRARGALFAAAGALTLALANSEPVLAMTRLSLSEHVTWIFLVCAFALFSSHRARRWVVGAALIGAALITRPNQAPALLATAFAFLVPHARLRSRPVFIAAAILIAVCLLPLAHNVYYGGRAVLFTTTAANPAALGVPVAALAKVPTDPTARREVLAQIRGLFFIAPLPSRPLGGADVRFVLYGLQGAWLAAVCVAWGSRRPLNVKLLVLVPALYLVVHIVYDIRFYYPRHILAAYFAMGLVAMTAVAHRD